MKFDELLDKLRKSCDLYSDILTTDKKNNYFDLSFCIKEVKKNKILNLNAKNQSIINNKANNNIENINDKVVYKDKNTSKKDDASISSKMTINSKKKNNDYV